ncbi:MAG: hypothetical protein O3C40_05435 [Planctomycetota bacterium]|nr:hypothetical protein [Planctomycetota bacterium]
MGNHDLPEQPGENFALAFDGHSSYVDIPSLKYDGSHPITVEAWATSFSTKHALVIGSNGRNCVTLHRYEHGFQLAETFDDTLSFDRADEKPEAYALIHIAGVLNDSKPRLFVNGKLAGQQGTSGGPIQWGEGDFLIGAAHLGKTLAYFFDGLIDEVRISNIARYTEDFTPQKRFEPDEHTIALYHFDEGSGEVAHDASDNRHDGKIIGAQWVTAEVTAKAIANMDPHRRAIAWARSVGGDVLAFKEDGTGEWLSSADQFTPEHVRLELSLKHVATDEGVANLAGASKIASLNLAVSAVTDRSVPHIMTLTNLETLDLDSTKVSLDGLKSIVSLPKLTTLHLYSIPIGDVGLAMLSKMRQLRDLSVTAMGGDADFTNAGLAHVGQLTNLESLLLGSGYRVSDDGIRPLSNLTKLKTLVLTPNGITGACLTHLANLTSLESLTLPARVADEDFRHLNNLKSLRVLSLVGSKSSPEFTGAGLKHLPDLPQLKELSMENSGLDDTGLEQITRFKGVTRLSIGLTKVTEAGFKYLTELPDLERVDIGRGSQLSVESIARLTLMLPECKIYSTVTDAEIAEAIEQLQKKSGD